MASPADLSAEQLDLVRGGAEPLHGREIIQYYEHLWELLKGRKTMTNGDMMAAIQSAQRQVRA
jgi:hypothetical protein